MTRRQSPCRGHDGQCAVLLQLEATWCDKLFSNTMRLTPEEGYSAHRAAGAHSAHR